MSDKAAKKKQYILDTAKNIFSEKGFKDVTMKDIVEACEISRGGLYMYFDSTEAVFEEILKQDAGKGSFAGAKTVDANGDAVAMFLTEQKLAILNSDKDLSVALYEYMFAKYSTGLTSECGKDAFASKTKLLADLIEADVEAGKLYADDCTLAAKNILYTLEGLKVASKTIGVTEEEFDDQLGYILSGFIIDTEEDE